MTKMGQEDEQTLAGSSSAHRRLKEKCKLVQTSYIKRIQFFLFALLEGILLLTWYITVDACLIKRMR